MCDLANDVGKLSGPIFFPFTFHFLFKFVYFAGIVEFDNISEGTVNINEVKTSDGRRDCK